MRFITWCPTCMVDGAYEAEYFDGYSSCPKCGDFQHVEDENELNLNHEIMDRMKTGL